MAKSRLLDSGQGKPTCRLALQAGFWVVTTQPKTPRSDAIHPEDSCENDRTGSSDFQGAELGKPMFAELYADEDGWVSFFAP
jgi:hypothetical protein